MPGLSREGGGVLHTPNDEDVRSKNPEKKVEIQPIMSRWVTM